jgi:hypothetical protein
MNQELSSAAAAPAPAILASAANNSGNRWWTYQRERFPVLVHGPVIAMFALAALCFSRLLRGAAGWPSLRSLAVAGSVSFLFFLQLRIADEWKDYADDLRFRPYRAVPRGLVSLLELRRVGMAAAALQLALTVWLRPALVAVLLAVWAYIGLMIKEFGAGARLKRHPAAYLLSHMLIMPLIYLYATACDWLPAGYARPALACFLACGFFLGMAFELARKIRAPRDEEPGVDTYTALWGPERAVTVWMAALLASFVAAMLASVTIGMRAPTMFVLALMLGAAAVGGNAFLRRPVTASALRIERLSALWTLALLFSVGPLPVLLAE